MKVKLNEGMRMEDVDAGPYAIREMPYGLVLAAKPRRGGRTAPNAGEENFLGRMARLWEAVDVEGAARWDAYAGAAWRRGGRRGARPSAYNAFVRETARALREAPGVPPPTEPPTLPASKSRRVRGEGV